MGKKNVEKIFENNEKSESCWKTVKYFALNKGRSFNGILSSKMRQMKLSKLRKNMIKSQLKSIIL